MQIKKSIAILYLLPFLLHAQFDKDSLTYTTKNYSNKYFGNSFDKLLNTYNFTAQLRQSISTDNLFFGINENFFSTINKTNDVNIKDEQYLKLFGEYGLSEKFKLGLLLNSNYYSDDRTLAINKVSILNTSLYTKIQPANYITITPFGGISDNNQIGEKDNGFIYGTEAAINDYDFGDFEISSLLKYQNEDISPRKNTFRYLNLDILNNIENDFRNTLSAFFTNQRKDFYFTADQSVTDEFGVSNNLQSRLETNYFIQEKFSYIPSSSSLTFNIEGRAAWRDIERNTRYISLASPASSAFDTKIKEFRLEFVSYADYKTDDLLFSFRFSFSEREEKHQPRKIDGLSNIIYNEREVIELQKNNNSKLANISLSGNYNFTKSDRLLFSFFHRKLIYDTPSELNFDDRDELLTISRLMYERIFNPYFKAFINIEGSINNTIYIFAERSANNNIKRILKLSAGGSFTTKKLITTNSGEVSANYTVFDFEQLNPTYRSYSFRQFVFRDSTTYHLTGNAKLFLTGYIKLSEQGDFKWDNFTNKPVRYLSEKYAEPKIFYRLLGLNFGIGLRYFILTTYNIKQGTEKEIFSEYRSIGPVIEVENVLSEKLQLRFYGWYEFINTENNSGREMANFNIKLLYGF
ncbi:MAG: hypothetical protein AB1521_15245 [Bacteroidota bacterium]